MKILAFDTTNQTLSIAILADYQIIAERNIEQENKQSELLIPLIEECLNEAKIWYQNLNLIAFTKGPGSFTGIRIGLSCAKALQITTNLPIVTLSSLHVIAYNKRNSGHKKILVVNDAKLDEFYIQEFDVINNKVVPNYEPQLINSSKIAEFFSNQEFLLLGSAKLLIKNLPQHCFVDKEEQDLILASNIALIAQELYQEQSLDKAEPLYIRKPKIGQRKT